MIQFLNRYLLRKIGLSFGIRCIRGQREIAYSEIGILSKILHTRLALISFLLATAMVPDLYSKEIA